MGDLNTFGKKSMPAIKEADYAVDKYRGIHRWVSLTIIITVIIYAFKVGYFRIDRIIIACGLSFVCIWFAEEIEDANNILNSKWVRWGGWIILLLSAIVCLILHQN